MKRSQASINRIRREIEALQKSWEYQRGLLNEANAEYHRLATVRSTLQTRTARMVAFSAMQFRSACMGELEEEIRNLRISLN